MSVREAAKTKKRQNNILKVCEESDRLTDRRLAAVFSLLPTEIPILDARVERPN